MEITGFISHRLSLCRSMALCAVGTLLFFGTPAAYPQSSLESDVDNARIIGMTHKNLGDDVIIARIKASATKFDLSALWYGPDASIAVGTIMNAYVNQDQKIPTP